MFSGEFSINRGEGQGCPLSHILFNLFINDIIIDNFYIYGVNIGNKKRFGGLFVEDLNGNHVTTYGIYHTEFFFYF